VEGSGRGLSSGISLEGLRTTKNFRIADVLAEIRKENLPISNIDSWGQLSL
jgi:hypothetical protein